MKTTAITLLFFFYLNSSLAQIPDYFNNDPKWICNEHHSGIIGAPCYLTYDYLYYIDGDTTIGINNYKKIMRKGWWNEDGIPCYTPPEYYNYFSFGLRQDGRKIYIHKYGQESIYVDYNLNIGDTLAPCFLIENSGTSGDRSYIVQSIDSVLFSSGYHRRYHFNFYDRWVTDSIPYYLLEGVGVFSDDGMSGLINGARILDEVFEWFGTINCYLQNGSMEYGSGNCDLSLFDFNVGIEELAVNSKYLIKVYDLMGRETKPCKNQVLIYYYSDGTTERVYTIQ